jgi:hypothetical protein
MKTGYPFWPHKATIEMNAKKWANFGLCSRQPGTYVAAMLLLRVMPRLPGLRGCVAGKARVADQEEAEIQC